jgi:hypothetical protein
MREDGTPRGLSGIVSSHHKAVGCFDSLMDECYCVVEA